MAPNPHQDLNIHQPRETKQVRRRLSVCLFHSESTCETTNLSDTILKIVRYEEILKESNPKILLTGAQRAPKGSCTTPECVARNATTHYPDRCQVKQPELGAKYSLRQMRPRGSNRNLKKAATPTAEQTGQADAPPKLDVDNQRSKQCMGQGRTAGWWIALRTCTFATTSA